MKNAMVQRVLDGLLADMRTGRAPRHSRLPTERDLSLRFDAARGTVRRALAELAEQGYVEVRPRQGVFVVDAIADPEAAETDLSPAVILEARLLIEPNIAELLVLHATDADIAAMRNALEMHEAATDRRGLEHWDAAFHDALVAATHNDLVIALYEKVTSARLRANWGSLKSKRTGAVHVHRYREQHRKIFNAVCERDAAAFAHHSRLHLHGVWNDVIKT